ASRRRRRRRSWAPMPARSATRPRRSASRSSTKRNSCAAPAPNPKLASHMSAPVHPTAATDGLTIGRGALQQLHRSLLRDAADAAIPILQEVGFAAGEGIYQAFCAWLPREGGVPHPGDLDAGSAQTPMCFFSSGMLADFLGRLSGEPVAVMEVECRSRNDGRCRFLSASPDTLNAVYAQMTEGRDYAEVLGAGH